MDVDTVAHKDDRGTTIEHARWLLEGISLGYVQHKKAHRWLGYAQALLVMHGDATLDDMKKINKDC